MLPRVLPSKEDCVGRFCLQEHLLLGSRVGRGDEVTNSKESAAV